MRLKKRICKAKEKGLDGITTTLLISPYQKHELLREMGEDCRGTRIEVCLRRSAPGFQLVCVWLPKKASINKVTVAVFIAKERVALQSRGDIDVFTRKYRQVLLIAGGIIAAVGLVFLLGRFGLGRLPGDILIKRET